MNITYLSDDILSMESKYRASFINSLGGFKSVVLIGTINANKQENLAIFSSLFHIGANPALCGLIFRPISEPRHSLDNILETKEYTINHLNKKIYKQAHQTSARYDKSISEFNATQLTAEYIPGIIAPFVKESKIKFVCKLEQKIDLKINGTTLLIGKIIYVSLPKKCIKTDGFIDIEKAGTITLSGLDAYHKTNKINRLSYAKPNSLIKNIPF